MFKQRAYTKGFAALTLALTLALTGCQGSGDNNGGNASGSPTGGSAGSPGATASSSPGASSSAGPDTGDAGASASPSAPAPSSSASASPTSAKPPAVRMGTVTALRLADEKSGWAGGDGWIARTDDGGADWTAQYSGSFTVNQLFALNADKVWATLAADGDEKAKLIRSTDGGKHWSEVGTVPNKGFLHFTNDSTAFSANAMTTDGGKTWTELNAPDHAVGDAYFHDAANGWAVRQSGGKYSFLHTADKGKSWQTVLTKAIPDGNAVTSTLIRSVGKNDAWIEVVGGSGMTQTSYAVFHTTDGGKSWQPVIVKNGAGSGPAPGFSMDEDNYPDATGTGPGALYVVNSKIAYLSTQCQACDTPNAVMETTDGGKSWAARKDEFTGYGEPFVAATDESHVWLIATDPREASVLYTSSDGGKSWSKKHTFATPKSTDG